MDFGNHQPLEPHVYPLWIILGISACFTVLLLFCCQLPFHFRMNTQFKQAEHDFQTLQYLESYESHKKLFEKFPECKRIKLRMVESLFCLEDKEKHILAFKYLSNVTLDRNEWAELKSYMPTEYADYFKESIKMS